MACSNQA